MKRILAITVFLAAVSGEIMSQDVHLTQYDASPVILNASLTGMEKDMKYRVVNQYRNQWDAVARKAYISTALSFDMPFKEKWGLGGYLLNDNSNRVYNSFNFVLGGSHDITMGSQDIHHLCVGLHAGIIHKRMRIGEYTYDNQYFNGGFDTDLPSNEVFQREVRLMPEVNMGFSYFNTDKSKAYNPHGGLAISHITNPRENFLAEGTESRLPLKYLVHGGCKYNVKEGFMLDPYMMFMRQRNVNEFNIGVRSFNDLKGADITLISGLQYRHQDAVIAQVGVFYGNFIYKISYDLNISPLKSFTSYRGGLEFSLTFFRRTHRGASSFS
jgi:type IX secretion system PorP/SprF family membrane protein